MKIIFICIFSLLFAIQGNTQINEKRLALVIGNANYSQSVLKTPINDANLMESTLQSLGFTVIKKTDVNRIELGKIINDFNAQLNIYNIILFFYSGYAIQSNGENYLIPIDAKIEKKDSVSKETISINILLSKLKDHPKNTTILIFDACRDIPFCSWISEKESGLKSIQPFAGSFIAFSASEGSTADNGEEVNSLFTENLVKYIKKPVSIETAFSNTRFDVKDTSGGAQVPQRWSKLRGDFYFVIDSDLIKQQLAIRPVFELEPSDSSQNDTFSVRNKTFFNIRIHSEHDGELFFDGKLLGNISKGYTYTVRNIDNGPHTLKLGNWFAKIKTEAGKTYEISTNSVSDKRDERIYETIKIGEQVWLAKNIAFDAGIGCWAYDNNQNNISKYGYLYNWETARYACPSGWHLPSREEYEILLNQLDKKPEEALKSIVTGGKTGFSMVFGGWYFENGLFKDINKVSNFWTSSTKGENNAWYLNINKETKKFEFETFKKTCCFSVRCVKNK